MIPGHHLSLLVLLLCCLIHCLCTSHQSFGLLLWILSACHINTIGSFWLLWLLLCMLMCNSRYYDKYMKAFKRQKRRNRRWDKHKKLQKVGEACLLHPFAKGHKRTKLRSLWVPFFALRLQKE